MEDFKKQLSFLELFIIDTVCFFDIFDYPLTITELYNFFYTNGMEGESFTFDDVKEVLATSDSLKKVIKQTQAFYHLAGRSEIVNKREERYQNSISKYKIALKAVKYLKHLPFIKFIGLCNNLSINNAEADSDIDFFIITKSKRLYSTRLLVTILLSLLGLRRHGNKINNRICLSFYLTENKLDLRPLMLDKYDSYLIFWLAWLQPLYDRGGYEKLILENYWLKQYLPNWSFGQALVYSNSDNSGYKFWEYILGGAVGNLFESFSRYLQNFKMSLNKKSLATSADTRVVISDDILKFHENDRREHYRELFEEKQREVLEKI